MCSRTLGNWYKNIPSCSPPVPLLFPSWVGLGVGCPLPSASPEGPLMKNFNLSRSQSQFRKGEKLICDRQIPLKHPEKIAKA